MPDERDILDEQCKEIHLACFHLLSDLNNVEKTVSRLRNEIIEIDANILKRRNTVEDLPDGSLE